MGKVKQQELSNTLLWDWKCVNCASTGLNLPVPAWLTLRNAVLEVEKHHEQANPDCHKIHTGKWIVVTQVSPDNK